MSQLLPGGCMLRTPAFSARPGAGAARGYAKRCGQPRTPASGVGLGLASAEAEGRGEGDLPM